MKLLILAFFIPVVALIGSGVRDWTPRWPDWKGRIKIALILFALGAYAASPFLSGSWVGTGESYNYDLSIADGVTQYRQGIFPILVGQTQYAFNGRIHPLRTAPYYIYAACALDTLTFHKLDFWDLQDLLLLVSVIGGTFSCYASLRHLVGVSRKIALGASALYVLSPGVLSAAYSMDLYMTVTTLPFLPLAVGAVICSAENRSPRIAVLLGVAVGITWLAHPPVALWLSTFTVVAEAGFIMRRFPTARDWLAFLVGAVSGLLVALYSFASTFSFKSGAGFMETQDFSPLHEALHQAFPGSLLPVSADAGKLSDFQLGYVLWGLIVVTVLFAAFKRRIETLIVCSIACFFLILVLPIPHVSWWLWLHLPNVFPLLTNIWPMQRLYLVATILIISAASQIFGRPLDSWWEQSPIKKWGMIAIYTLALAWTGWQAQPYLHRGSASVRSKTVALEKLRPENIDLTVTSYALLGIPSYYYYGTVDADRWFRLLKDKDLSEIATNWDAKDPGPLKVKGEFKITETNPVGIQLEPDLRIGPNRKYLLALQFRSQPIHSVLTITGEHFRREYILPSSDQFHGFGMKPDDQHSLVLWTTNPTVTTLHFQFMGVDPATGLLGAPPTFTLYQLDPNHFPVQVQGWTPLSGTVESTQNAWIETPRRFIPGYAAAVDGKPVAVGKSPEGSVMFHIPPGQHHFVLSYPGTRALRLCFWISFLSFVAIAASMLAFAIQGIRAAIVQTATTEVSTN